MRHLCTIDDCGKVGGKKVPDRYLKGHINFHHGPGRKFSKRSQKKNKNIRLARARRKQKYPASLKFRGPFVKPPKPEQFVALFDSTHQGVTLNAI